MNPRCRSVAEVVAVMVELILEVARKVWENFFDYFVRLAVIEEPILPFYNGDNFFLHGIFSYFSYKMG